MHQRLPGQNSNCLAAGASWRGGRAAAAESAARSCCCPGRHPSSKHSPLSLHEAWGGGREGGREGGGRELKKAPLKALLGLPPPLSPSPCVSHSEETKQSSRSGRTLSTCFEPPHPTQGHGLIAARHQHLSSVRVCACISLCVCFWLNPCTR